MFITETFAYLHEPKTGGTFVAATLAKIHQARGDRVDTVWVDPENPDTSLAAGPGRVVRMMLTTRNQHGARRHLPPPCAGLPLLATIRNPYDRYVSQFEFAWWRTEPAMFGPVDEVRRRYPNFPELAFFEFVELANTSLLVYPWADPDSTPGFHVRQFVDYFTRRPEDVLPQLADPGFTLGHLEPDLRDVHLVDQAHLNEGLHAFLLGMGYTEEELRFVRDAGRILPPDDRRIGDSHVTPRDWRTYYNPEQKAFVRRKERLLFEMFPQFDV